MPMKPICTLLLSLAALSCFCQISLDDYLPAGEYLPEIPEPGEIIGHEVGEWHLTHDKLTWYMKEVAASSDQVV